ncbi:MAG TPA: orotidine-5'-phosphate decarboxylase [Verrucomicrobiae bacterium]|jgi:orotidine-5'-phosphate decarboxylase|nr:orotidine-5'-phosphate decarboxylase [Verrucomicrobiae bacterium]
MKNADKIIVALDTPSLDFAERLIKDLEGLISFYKVGFEFFTAHGWAAVDIIRRFGGKVFLDLKLHDIPNTVAKTMAVVCEHEIDMVNVHALGGKEMMVNARKTVDQQVQAGKKRPIVIGVTVLTSHSEQELSKELGIMRSLNEEVLSLAALVQESGLDGVVSSPQEIVMLRQKFPEKFVIVTPGVRPEGSEKSDQKRTFTPNQALQAGSDYLVIGRPITAAADPRKEVETILASMKPVATPPQRQ